MNARTGGGLFVTEGLAVLDEHLADIPSKKMPVFYNPRMVPNRDFFLWVLASWTPVRDFGIAFAGSGVLGVRSLLELPVAPERVHLNDLSSSALDLARSNVLKNGLPEERFAFTHLEASRFLMDSDGFDALDLDPFGTPIHSLKAAVQSLREGALLGVNALDTAALYGTYPKVCQRRYWALSAKCDSSKEFSARILIRRVQLEAASFDKAVFPVLSIVKDHYVRVFFRAEKGVPSSDKMLSEHGFVYYGLKSGRIELEPFDSSVALGPMWLGGLFDSELLKRMRMVAEKGASFCSKGSVSVVDRWIEDSSVGSVGYYDVHRLASRRFARVRPMGEIVRLVGGARSSFEHKGFKTLLGFEELVRRLS
jgi:tRNA (guanine26-N2/guanine27-N2)-dimethyltransferase